MPGVLMLEALTQAGAWLIRDMEDFAHSIIILKQARTIKYGSFVEPGRQLELRVELTEYDGRDCTFKGVGVIDGQEMVKGRFTLTRYNLRDKDAELHVTDSSIVAGLRDLYSTLRKGSVGAKAIARKPDACRLPYTCLASAAWTCGSCDLFLMMLQRFAVLLMMCRIPAPTPGGCLPGVGVRNDIPQRSPI